MFINILMEPPFYHSNPRIIQLLNLLYPFEISSKATNKVRLTLSKFLSSNSSMIHLYGFLLWFFLLNEPLLSLALLLLLLLKFKSSLLLQMLLLFFMSFSTFWFRSFLIDCSWWCSSLFSAFSCWLWNNKLLILFCFCLLVRASFGSHNLFI